MASLTDLGDGRWQLRASFGLDERGQQIRRSRTFEAATPTQARRAAAESQVRCPTCSAGPGQACRAPLAARLDEARAENGWLALRGVHISRAKTAAAVRQARLAAAVPTPGLDGFGP